MLMIQKLSTRQPELESRIKVLKEIAAENDIVLQLEVASSISREENLDVDKKEKQDETNTSTGSAHIRPGDGSQKMTKDDEFSDSMMARKKYKDVADAAQAAFESAAYAASAARAAVELSRSQFHDSDDDKSPITRKASDKFKPTILESETKTEDNQSGSQAVESKHSESAAELERAVSSSSSDLTVDNIMVPTMSFDYVDHVKLLEKDIVFDESDIEDSGFSHKPIHSSCQGSLKVESAQPSTHVAEGSGSRSKQHVNMFKGAVSVRTRQVRGY